MIHPTLSHFHSHISSTPADRDRLRLRPRSAHARIGPGPGVAVPTLCMRYLHAEYSVYEETQRTPLPWASTRPSGVASIVHSRCIKSVKGPHEPARGQALVGSGPPRGDYTVLSAHGHPLIGLCGGNPHHNNARARSRVVRWDASCISGARRVL